MGALDGLAVERAAASIREPHDVLAATPRLGSGRDIARALARAFLAELDDADKLRWDECFADGSFAPAKKGGLRPARPSAARARSGMVVVDGAGTPLGARLDSASPHEVTLLERTLATIAVPRTHSPGDPGSAPTA